MSILYRIGGALQHTLRAVISLAFLAKLGTFFLDSLAEWEVHINMLLFMLLGLYGVLLGLYRHRSILGILVLVSGVYLSVSYLLPEFYLQKVLMFVASIVVFLGILFLRPRERG